MRDEKNTGAETPHDEEILLNKNLDPFNMHFSEKDLIPTSDEESEILNWIEYHVESEHTEKQIFADLELKGYSTRKIKKLFNQYKKICPEEIPTEPHMFGTEDFLSDYGDIKAMHFLTSLNSEIAPLSLWPGLSPEQIKEKTAELKDETREKANKVIAFIPAIRRIIKEMEKIGEKAAPILIKYGSDYLYMPVPYWPKWTTKSINWLLIHECMLRKSINNQRRNLLKPDLSEEGIYTQEWIKQQEKKQKRDQRNIARLINAIAKDPKRYIDKKFYQSYYYKAAEHIQNIPTKYAEKDGDFSVQELALLYFFAQSKLIPDAKANLKKIKTSNLTKIARRIDRFFTEKAAQGKTQYTTLIEFLDNEIRPSLPPGKQSTTTPQSSHTPQKKEYRFPTIYGEGMSPDDIADMRIFIQKIYAFYEKEYLQGGVSDRQYIDESSLINEVAGSLHRKETAIEKHKRAEELFEKACHCWGIIGDMEYPLLLPWAYNRKTKLFVLVSPYVEARHFLVWKNAKPSKREKNKKYINPEEPEKELPPIPPDIPFLKMAINNENPYVQDLTYAIFTEMIAKAKYKHYEHCPARLINEQCTGALKAAMQNPNISPSRKTQILNRTYTRFYKILNMQNITRFYEYFLPYEEEKEIEKEIETVNEKGEKITEKVKIIVTEKIKPFFYMEIPGENPSFIRNPTPTYKKWREQTIMIKYGGKNPDFKRLN